MRPVAFEETCDVCGTKMRVHSNDEESARQTLIKYGWEYRPDVEGERALCQTCKCDSTGPTSCPSCGNGTFITHPDHSPAGAMSCDRCGQLVNRVEDETA